MKIKAFLNQITTDIKELRTDIQKLKKSYPPQTENPIQAKKDLKNKIESRVKRHWEAFGIPLDGAQINRLCIRQMKQLKLTLDELLSELEQEGRTKTIVKYSSGLTCLPAGEYEKLTPTQIEILHQQSERRGHITAKKLREDKEHYNQVMRDFLIAQEKLKENKND